MGLGAGASMCVDAGSFGRFGCLLNSARDAVKFVVFDACRNELRLPTKHTAKGLRPVAEQQGLFIAFGSAPGETASDQGEKKGLMRQHLRENS
jgi:hypothetical protein